MSREDFPEEETLRRDLKLGLSDNQIKKNEEEKDSRSGKNSTCKGPEVDGLAYVHCYWSRKQEFPTVNLMGGRDLDLQ